jgi:predicted TIM-barrel fold metal-dependent hydrolase
VRQFVQSSPEAFAGIFVTAFKDPDHALEKLREAHSAGFVGVVLPTVPPDSQLDYNKPEWGQVWQFAEELNLPLTFHALAAPEYGLADGMGHRAKSPIQGYLNVTRNPQQLISFFIGSRIFDKHPRLRVVTAEADASWAPHLAVRLRHWASVHGVRQAKGDEAEDSAGHNPDDYLFQNVWYAVTDDTPALRMRHEFGPAPRLLWCDSYPSAETDWPRSDAYLVATAAEILSAEELDGFTRTTAAALYGLPLPVTQA